jgi:adenylate cyclase
MKGSNNRNVNMRRLTVLICFVLIYVAGIAQTKQLNDTTAVNQLLKQAVFFQTVNLDSCYMLSIEALVLSEQLNYQRGIKKACVRLGSVMIAKGNSDSAEAYLLRAKDISKVGGDATSIAGISMLLSYVYQDKGKPTAAFAALYESLAFSQREKNELLITQNYNTLGDLYSTYKDYPKALLFHQKGLQKARVNNFRDEVGTALMGIGGVYYFTHKIEQALAVYIEADSLWKQSGSDVNVAQNLANIALCYADLKQEKKALTYYDQALEAYQKQGMEREEANLYYNMGDMYFGSAQFDKAIYYLEKGLVIAQKTGELEKVSMCYELLAKTYAKKGNYNKAYDYHIQYSLLSDSLIDREKVRSISDMQTKYETEIKTREIKVLQGEKEVAKLKASRSLGINFGLGGALLGIIFVAFAFYNQSKKKQRLNLELSVEKQKSDDLLLNILPVEIADELKQSGTAKAKQYDHVTVLFTDFVNFTGVSMTMSPTELVEEINRNFTAFDAIMDEYGLEKIKTIGDAYLAVCGLPNETADHAQRVIRAAFAIQQFMNINGGKFQIRMGVHTGAVVAGIVGVKKYAYDIWGDTVNTAARMEQHSELGKINISGVTYELIKNDFACEHRGKIVAKNKGEVDMYFVTA